VAQASVYHFFSDHPEKEFQVMIPESKLDARIKKNEELRKLSYHTLFHKHFYENIDHRFPYPDLTLQQIGVPLFDVLEITTDEGTKHIELSNDATLFGISPLT